MSDGIGIWLRIIAILAAGVLSASAMIVAKKPNAKEMIDKIVPYAGVIGLVLLFFGIYDFFGLAKGDVVWWKKLDALKIFTIWGKIYILLWAPVAILLGFFQGYSLLDKYVFNKADAHGGKAGDVIDNIGDTAHAKLANIAGPLGIVGIVVGLVMLLMELEILKVVSF